MKSRNGVFYFPNRESASGWAKRNGWPTEFIRLYGLGYAIQACEMGGYAGPDKIEWPGAYWKMPAE